MRAPSDARIVVVKARSKISGITDYKLALYAKERDGKVYVHCRLGHGSFGGYHPKATKIEPAQLLRDASPREIGRGLPMERAW